MLLKLEKADGTAITWEGANVGITECAPGSVAVTKRGLSEGFEVDVARVRSAIIEKPVGGGKTVTEDYPYTPGETVTVHVPRDGKAAYVMNDKRTTMRTLRWPPKAATAEKEREVA